MKCPCCGETTSREILVVNNRIYVDGRPPIAIDPRAGAILVKLLAGAVIGPNKGPQYNTFNGSIFRLRQVLKLSKLNYSVILCGRRTYRLFKIEEISNGETRHRTSERPQDVHS